MQFEQITANGPVPVALSALLAALSGDIERSPEQKEQAAGIPRIGWIGALLFFAARNLNILFSILVALMLAL